MTSRLVLIAAAFATVAGSAFAQSSLVANVGNFIHDVGDLDRSAHFYHDVLGMDMPRPVGDWQTGEQVLAMYDAVGGKFRVANAQIPGSPMRMELAEFQGVERTPVRRAWGAPGNSLLMLTVRDLAPVAARVASENVPVLVKRTQACDGRGMVVADPDGFPVMLIERNGPAADAEAKSNFTGLRFGFLVSGDALAKGPFAALGLKSETRTHVCRPIEEALAGSSSVVTLPGGFEVWLFQAQAGQAADVRPQNPGAAVLRLMVTDVDAAVGALKQSGVNVVSAGGVLQTLPGGLRAGILGAPDGLLIQVVK